MKTFESIIKKAPESLSDTIQALDHIHERNDYHPEYSVYQHTKIVTERLLLTKNPDLIMAAIFHDIGKAMCYEKIKISEALYNNTQNHLSYTLRILDDNADFIKKHKANLTVVKFIIKHYRLSENNRQKFASHPLYDQLELFRSANNMNSHFYLTNNDKA